MRSAPDLGRFHSASAPSRSSGAARLICLCYLGVMGPQDGVDYALRALATAARRARPRTRLALRYSSATATPSTRWWPSRRSSGLSDRSKFTGSCARRGPAALPVHRRRVPVARPVQSAQRRVDHEQGPGVHGDGPADRVLRSRRGAGVGCRLLRCTSSPTTNSSSPRPSTRCSTTTVVTEWGNPDASRRAGTVLETSALVGFYDVCSVPAVRQPSLSHLLSLIRETSPTPSSARCTRCPMVHSITDVWW